MKKAILMVAAMGMVGGANAQQTTVVQPVSATVANVCTYQVDDRTDVNGKTYTQGNKDLGTYKANEAKDGSVGMGAFYIFRCTSGTNWDTQPFAKTGEITLTRGGAASTAGDNTLKVQYTVTTEDQPNTVNGDIHSAGVNFTINAGQWRSVAGSYSGELSVTIQYN